MTKVKIIIMVSNNRFLQKNRLPTYLITAILLLMYSCTTPKTEHSIYENPDWAIQLTNAYKAFNKSKDPKSADLIFKATEQMPKKNWENYFVCAMVYAEYESKQKAFLSIDRAIEYGLRDVELLKDIPEFNSLRDTPEWDELISRVQNVLNEYLLNIENPALFKELQELWTEDQQALSTYEKEISMLDSNATLDKYEELFKPVEMRWDINKTKLDSIIRIHGWPRNQLVGEDGAKIAWSIAQHHPNVFFKKKCLALIKEEVDKGHVNPNFYAELNDRIARDTWQKQTFGASMGNSEPYPIKNVEEVNKRRIALGLFEPIEVYALYHGIDYNIPSKAEVDSLDQLARTDYQSFEHLYHSGQTDSSVVFLQKAIKAHGAISNEQLFSAALKLAKSEENHLENLCTQILKVLIWREWEGRFDILRHSEFKSAIRNSKWLQIKNLLNESRHL